MEQFVKEEAEEVSGDEKCENGNVDGGDPPPTPTPTPILPEEIWETILGKLTSVKDLQSCSETCSLWNRLLHLTIPDWFFNKIFPALYKYLDKSTVLNCRLVNKNWKEAVDTFMENHPSLITYSSTTPSSHLRLPSFDHSLEEKGLGPYIFRNRYPFWKRMNDNIYTNVPRSLNRVEAGSWIYWAKLFLAHLGTQNLFIGRFVSITEYLHEEDERLDVFWPVAYIFLSKCGKHLHHLNLSTHRRIPSEVDNGDVYAFMGIALTLAPHLKTLSVSGKLARSEKNTRRYEQAKPFPRAQNLVRLQLGMQGMNHSVIYSILKKYCGQLRRLDIIRWKAPYSRLIWRNLTELHLTNVQTDKALEPLIRANLPKLRKLGVSLKYKGKRLDKLGEVIGHFKRLEVVRISIPDVGFATSLLKKAFVASPKLKTLEVHQTPLISRNLMRQLKVENVHINWQKAEIEGYVRVIRYWLHADEEMEKGIRPIGIPAKGQDHIVHLHPCGGSFYGSNVWEEVDTVKLITFQGYAYTREGYLKYKETHKCKKSHSQ